MRTEPAARPVLFSVSEKRASLARRCAWRGLIVIRPVTRFAWLSVERRFKRLHVPLPVATPHGLVRAYPVLYEEEFLQLQGGCKLMFGLPILDLHFDSQTAARLGAAESGGNGFFRAGMEDLAAIADYVEGLPRRSPYVAVRARTILRNLLLRARAEVRERPRTLRTRLEQLFQEMAVIIFRQSDSYGYLVTHHAPIADAWYSIDELLAFSKKRALKAPH